MEISFNDFFQFFPNSHSNNFSLQLAEDFQFAQYASLPKEPRPKLGKKFRHQLFASEFFKYYRELLVIHKPGTGKTCLATAVSETLKNFQSDLCPKIKRIYIISSPMVLSNFQQEIVCHCTNHIYNKIENKDLTINAQTHRINTEIRKYYTFDTYRKFTKKIRNLGEDEINETFSNCLFILDEIHNLVVKEEGETDNYDDLKTFFDNLPGRKILGLTATPIRSSPEELGKLLNLISIEKIPLKNGFFIEGKTIEELFPYFKGKISYLRPMTQTVEVEFPGVPLSDFISAESSEIVYPIEMSSFQNNIYLKTVETFGNKGVYIRPREAANFVFPNGSYGIEGYKKYVIYKKKKKFWEFTDEFTSLFRNKSIEEKLTLVEKYSAKFAKILRTAYENPNKKITCYQEFKIASGGVILVLLFELVLDYEIITSEFLTEIRTSSEYCETNEVIIKEKKKRVGFLTREFSQGVIKTLINFYNIKENLFAEYFQVLIFTPIGREGLSFNNVQIAFIEPTWRPSSSEQARKRNLRDNSHADLEKFGKVKVEIYQLIIKIRNDEYNVAPKKNVNLSEVENNQTEQEISEETTEEDMLELIENAETKENSKNSETNENTKSSAFNIDLLMYEIQQNISNLINPYLKMAKECSVNVFLDRERNLQNDNSQETEFFDAYIGKFVNPLTYDYSYDYNSFWIIEPPNIVQYLQDKFYFNESMSIKEIAHSINKPEEVILQIINYLIEENITFETRFGFKGFLTFSENLLVLSPIKNGKVEDFIYFENKTFKYQHKSWNGIVNQELLRKNFKILDEFFEKPTSFITAILKKIINLPIAEKNYVYEKSFLLENNMLAREVKKFYKCRTFNINNLIVSTMLNDSEDLTPFKLVDVLLRPKIFRVFDGEWRQATIEENLTFSVDIETIHQDEINEKIGLEYGFYGIKVVDSSENIRILDDYITNRSTGKVCGNQIPDGLKAKYFYYLDINIGKIDKSISIEKVEKILEQSGFSFNSEEEAYYMYTWLTKTKVKYVSNEICKILEKAMIEKNLVIFL